MNHPPKGPLVTSVPVIELNNGVRMPQVGYGVFQVPDDETATAVKTALETGYRSIDTAAVYGNEKGVGQAIAESGIARDDSTLKAFDESMTKLGLEQLDLYLIHWPTPARGKFLDTWKAFEKLYTDGRVRAIGVSNFQPSHLERLLDAADVAPAVNQVELHPYLQQRELREFDAKHGIATEAWSPLAKGGSLLGDPVVAELAVKHSRTPAQIVLRWHLQLDNVVIPKSVTPSRIEENFDLFGFTLTEEEMESLTPLDRGERTGPDPDTFNAA
jgi:diketogulonate reductase-like aldo/keto reductase